MSKHFANVRSEIAIERKCQPTADTETLAEMDPETCQAKTLFGWFKGCPTVERNVYV